MGVLTVGPVAKVMYFPDHQIVLKKMAGTTPPSIEKKGPLPLLLGIGIGAVVTALIFLLIRKQPLDTLSIKFSGKEVSLGVRTSKIESDSVLKTLFSTDFSTAGTVGWLEKNKSIYPIGDTKLADVIQQLDHADPLCEALRRMQSDRSGPFAIVADSAYVSVPGRRTVIPPDTLYTWDKGRYDGTKIKLMDPLSQEVMTFICIGNMGAKPVGYTGRVEFNMSKQTAMRLFDLKTAKDITREMKVYVTYISKLP